MAQANAKITITFTNEEDGSVTTEVGGAGFTLIELLGLLEDVKYDLLKKNKRIRCGTTIVSI